ncbi:hypothetical protein CMI47_19425 [Candidatus Pacearchaeota archaeon]|nr:hypothetical protein [Candidatus Pacearchaeota archaeon]|tara:strand:+ start:682 stop:939 length:258 start_codon:yes stop_codon:yes gene_type:complete
MSLSIGRLVFVENAGSARGSSCYNQLTFINSEGSVEQILLTDRELDNGKARAEKNHADLLGVSLIDRLVAFKMKLFVRLLSLFGM